MAFSRLRHSWLLLTLAACQAAPSCGGEPQTGGTIEPTSIEFDETRAWDDLTYLVETIGRRRIGTEGAARTREYIRQQLGKLGWQFEEHIFEAVTPEGANRKGTVTGTNLIARWPGTEDKELWIASHYDTFDRPKFVGANDAGSSTAVLIELGRQWAGEAGTPRPGPGLTLVWFDGEEPFYPVRWDDDTNSTFGSRALAAKLQEEGRTDEVAALVLLDMVGDKKLGLELEAMSTDWLKRVFRQAAGQLDYDRYIVGEKEIKDDHRPFLNVGIPAIDLIDFNFDSASNRYWHTADDTLDKCSPQSLGIVGRLVMTAIDPLVEEARKRGRL